MKPKLSRLFVIKKMGADQYWACSTEHGAGWSDGHPKQSFSPSELTREIRRLIDQGWFCSVEIVELVLAEGLMSVTESPRRLLADAIMAG